VVSKYRPDPLLLRFVVMQSMYIRVKRKKTTIFLTVEPTDTVLEVKQKLQALIDKVCPAAAASPYVDVSWHGAHSSPLDMSSSCSSRLCALSALSKPCNQQQQQAHARSDNV